MFRIFKKKADFSDPVGSPDERVKAFIAHWHTQWAEAQRKMQNGVDFEYWRKQASQVDEAHFVQGFGSGSGNSFSSVPTFDPACEKITQCEIQGEHAQVHSEDSNDARRSPRYHVFQLERGSNGDWLISSLLELLYPPLDPVVDSELGASALAISDPACPLKAPEANLDLSEDVLFQGGRTIDIPHLGEGTTELRQFGKIRIRSGVLAILDFAYNIYELEPLHRKVDAGEYSVEVVEIHNRVAGVRVKFREDQSPTKWYAASTPSGNGIYGVDAANLAILDVEGLLGLSHLRKEKLFDEWARDDKPTLMSLTNDDDCLITSSGFGDGAYPAFWGVDDSDRLVTLYIDFLVLVEEKDDGTLVSV